MRGGDATGFTVMEVLVAVTVFAIGIMATTAMQLTAIQTNATARMLSEASGVAAQQSELLRDRPYPHADLRQLDPGQPLPEHDWGILKTSWQVRENFPEKDSKTVTVTVTGLDRGRERTVVIDRIIALGQ